MSKPDHQAWLDNALQGVLAGEPIENISAVQPDIATDEAYALQRQLIDMLVSHGGWGRICGYKAALTAEPAQQAMGVHEPVIGVLFDNGAHTANGQTALAITPDRPVLLETELGFTLGQNIDSPVTPDSVTDLMSTCQAMIELASPNLQQRPAGVDLVSTNSASYGFIQSAFTADPKTLEVDQLEVSLSRLTPEHETLHSFPAGTVMGGQYQALAWLINTVLAQGYPLEAGHVLMTGSIGSMHPGTAGEYLADFGVLGQLGFKL